jgi:hypothetical protein
LLTAVLERKANRDAGGQRVNVNDLLPGADDPFEGSVDPDFMPEGNYDWFDPTVNPDDPTTDFSGMSAASGPGKPGKGMDWFRGGEAPNNYQNRNNPLYQARRDFSVAIAPQLEDQFGVSAHGSAGHLRAPQKGDAAPGGRSANSDHYSGGATDFFGTVEELDALHDFLITQPYVSFIRWRSESHGGPEGTDPSAHLHVSYDLGWIAQNYYKGKTIPPPAPTVSGAPPESSERPETTEPLRPAIGVS